MKQVLIVIMILFSTHLRAGAEHELAVMNARDCTLRVTHDAVPSLDTGSILFKAFTIRDGVHAHCEVQKEEVYRVLNEGLSNFRRRANLKPITSIMMGRLVDFSWMVVHLEKLSNRTPTVELTYKEVGEIVFESPISEPFRNAAAKNGFIPIGVSCEKVMYYENGALKDASCFLSLSGS